jgi:hypothetical protein
VLESWRVTSSAAPHHVSIFGQQLSYPVASVDALLVLALAAWGLMVTTAALRAAVRELAASRRFQLRLIGRESGTIGGAVLIDEPRPRAFCAGLLRPRVYISTGALSLLDESSVDAVLAHERHHARRYDPLRLAAGRVLTKALYFVPGLEGLIARHQAIAELGADESAVKVAPENRSALARAMLSFADAASADDRVGVDPQRVDHLLGEPLAWRFPVLIALVTTLGVGLLVALAVLAGQVSGGSATLSPPFLSRQPCVVVLAMVPAVLAFIAVRFARTPRLRTRPRLERQS